ncbi:hypothetical protein EV363DRAFT_638327 [Boletus edulis]|uniref:DUF6533 domain-containing protein n=1 Tax=Boletus edulis BED1 TaxID=1328754 RepID=A0AAD4BG61_BOLED|nr:hypothetical protein EV363DRAFT_638327 [Boletus edulis]KAF8427631.1 hypothetical protein L210DRAFT_3136918 [Boletus edulis BED1]
MSSDLPSVLKLLQLNNYTSVVIVTAVTYDYFLTLSREIDYVWCKPWTWISTMFVLVRYVGLCWAILSGLIGSTFVPGPMIVSTASFLAIYWTFPIFLIAADLVMVMRVYAMWNQSKWILSFLLLICVPQTIASFILAGIYYNPNTYFSATIDQVYTFSFCNGFIKIPSSLLLGVAIPRFVLSAVLLILAVISTLKESLELYKATKLWQPNQYMQRLLRDGILYFLVNMLYNTHDIITTVVTTNATLPIYLATFSYIAICPLVPRFIISVRELYDQLRNRSWGVDTGFGVFSQPSQDAAIAVSFTDVMPDQDQTMVGVMDEAEVIQLDALGGNTHRV